MADNSNRLPHLAAEIRRAHRGVHDAAVTTAERCIEAGHALIEAKALVKHGEWLPFLKEHCDLPERTAQLYMKIARTGLESATVADIGLRAAAKVEWTIYDPNYDPFALCDDTDKRDWHIFTLWLSGDGNANAVRDTMQHTEWILRKEFRNPVEWLGAEGDEYRLQNGMRKMPEKTRKNWRDFHSAHEHRTIDDLVSELNQRAK